MHPSPAERWHMEQQHMAAQHHAAMQQQAHADAEAARVAAERSRRDVVLATANTLLFGGR